MNARKRTQALHNPLLYLVPSQSSNRLPNPRTVLVPCFSQAATVAVLRSMQLYAGTDLVHTALERNGIPGRLEQVPLWIENPTAQFDFLTLLRLGVMLRRYRRALVCHALPHRRWKGIGDGAQAPKHHDVQCVAVWIVPPQDSLWSTEPSAAGVSGARPLQGAQPWGAPSCSR